MPVRETIENKDNTYIGASTISFSTTMKRITIINDHASKSAYIKFNAAVAASNNYHIRIPAGEGIFQVEIASDSIAINTEDGVAIPLRIIGVTERYYS